MTAPYQPTEAAIASVLEKFTPRMIAIAYLRATRRARDAEMAFDVMGNVAELTVAAATGNVAAAQEAVDKAARRMRSHKEQTE